MAETWELPASSKVNSLPHVGRCDGDVEVEGEE